ncbi:MAG: dihydropteroate synthase [Bacteroides sp.]|nr:dihydropteroate synthase [Bacteroides sp.]
MGIVNATPDSFYAQSRVATREAIMHRVAEMLEQGVDIIDVGACSTRPGSDSVGADEELRRLEMALAAVREVSGDVPVSVDTFRADVARRVVCEMEADIINDIGEGDLDADMFGTIADLQVPYVLMHTRGTPAEMQNLAKYDNVTVEVTARLSAKLALLEELGVNDVIVDPGFGFAKTLAQNYELLRNIPHIINVLRKPLLVGLSRKSMLTRLLGIEADNALNATTVANTIALMNGASVLRVHDVRAACEVRKIVSQVV